MAQIACLSIIGYYAKWPAGYQVSPNVLICSRPKSDEAAQHPDHQNKVVYYQILYEIHPARMVAMGCGSSGGI